MFFCQFLCKYDDASACESGKKLGIILILIIQFFSSCFSFHCVIFTQSCYFLLFLHDKSRPFCQQRDIFSTSIHHNTREYHDVFCSLFSEYDKSTHEKEFNSGTLYKLQTSDWLREEKKSHAEMKKQNLT